MDKENNWSYTMAFWLLRFWLATRCIGTGLIKFVGMKKVIKPEFAELDQASIDALGNDAYDMVNGIGISCYHGLPAKGPMSLESFQSNMLMPSFMVGPYAYILGFSLIGLGVALLLGICTRLTLFLMGMLFISLTYGFVILEKSLGPDSAAGAAYMGVHVLIVVVALILAKYNKVELLKCPATKFCKCNKAC